jgi:hypothetical protein
VIITVFIGATDWSQSAAVHGEQFRGQTFQRSPGLAAMGAATSPNAFKYSAFDPSNLKLICRIV